jgi:hypothetical protein
MIIVQIASRWRAGDRFFVSLIPFNRMNEKGKKLPHETNETCPPKIGANIIPRARTRLPGDLQVTPELSSKKFNQLIS